MKHPTAPLSSLGARVADAQDRRLKSSGLFPDTRQAFLAKRLPARSRERWVMGAHALAGAAIAAGVLLWFSQRPIRYETHGLVTQRSETGDFIQAPVGQGAVEFSDGSQVVMSTSTRARVEAVSARGARIRLDHGAIEARIVHRARTDWSFFAGPFTVAVVGTGFDMRWDAADGSLTLKVKEGAVRVSGCSLPDLGVTAGQGATLRCPAAGPAQALGTAPVVAASASAQVELPASSPDAGVHLAAVPEVPTPADAALVATEDAEVREAAAGPDWRVLAAQGKLREAYAIADASGFDAECDRAGAREVLDLADSALFAGRTDRAKSALLVARRRFAGSAVASLAAYKLGRIAFDRTGALGDARTWFETYLQEAPSGGLARESLGRLLEIDHRTGNTARAKARAEQYLRQYPDGPHSELAKKVMAP